MSKADEFLGLHTEIGAGMVLVPKSEADSAWNDACVRAMRLAKRYAEGKGLFQLEVPAKNGAAK